MSAFQTPLVSISDIEPHPNADRLELAQVLGYTCVVRKGQFEPGQQVVYLPEASVLPEWLCRALNLWSDEDGKGRLAGPEGLRIKAIRLRGTVSQGLLYPVTEGRSGSCLALEGGALRPLEEGAAGAEIAAALGVVKYEPPIPVAFEGEVVSAHGHTVRIDIENLQAYPHAIQPGEQVVMTEKLHGTWTGMSFDPALRHPDLYEGGTLVTSKGMSAKGLAFKTGEANDRNLYVRTWRRVLLAPGHWDCVIAEAPRAGARDPRPGRDLRARRAGPAVRPQEPGVPRVRRGRRGREGSGGALPGGRRDGGVVRPPRAADRARAGARAVLGVRGAGPAGRDHDLRCRARAGRDRDLSEPGAPAGRSIRVREDGESGLPAPQGAGNGVRVKVPSPPASLPAPAPGLADGRRRIAAVHGRASGHAGRRAGTGPGAPK